MIQIILAILLILLGAYFASQNTALVALTFATFTSASTPLYVVVIGSLLLGLVIGWVMQLILRFSSTRTIHGKDKELKDLKKTVTDLTKKIHTLELQNAELRGDAEEIDDKSL